MWSQEMRRQLFRTFPELQRALKRLIEPVLAAAGLTPVQYATLLYIWRNKGSNVGALARDTGLGQANTSTLCKRLEREGLLLRERSSADERVVMLALTGAGEAALARVEQGFQHYDRQLARVPAEQIALFQNAIDSAAELLKHLTPFSSQKGDTTSNA